MNMKKLLLVLLMLVFISGINGQNATIKDTIEYGRSKALMVTEFGSLEVGGSSALWYKQALDSLPAKYPAMNQSYFITTLMTKPLRTKNWIGTLQMIPK